jgi:peptidyl-prolyl cis-trans isomerase D
LVKNAKIFDLAVIETGSFSRQGPDALGSDKGAFAAAAFALQTDEISDIQDIGDRYYLIQPTETIDAVVPGIEAVKAKVEMDLIKKMQTDKAREDAEAMSADLREGKAFEESAASHGVDVKHTGLFTRNARIPDIGSDQAFTKRPLGYLQPAVQVMDRLREARVFTC